MFNRLCFGALLLAGLALTFTGCGTSPSLTSIVVSPSGTVTVEMAPPGYVQGSNQYTAIGYYTHPGHPAKTVDISSSVTWKSSDAQVATVSSSGLATATGFNSGTGLGWYGNTSITASAPGFNGDVVSNAVNFTVTACGLCANTDITKVDVIPATQTVASLNVPIQFEAIGTTASGLTVALTGLSGVSWVSSEPTVATINQNTGLAITTGSGTTTITATFMNSDGTAADGTATVTVSPTGSPEPLTAMTVAPNAQTALALGQTAQFLAIATTGNSTSVNLTNQTAVVNGKTIQPAVWTSSNPSVATVDSKTGIAKSIAAGAAVITAIAYNPDTTVVSGAATYTVTVSTTSGGEPLTALAIVPGTQSVASAGQTAQLLAIGTFSASSSTPGTQNMANISTYSMAWYSSNPQAATINASTGLVTAVGTGVTAITAIATNISDKSAVYATAVFTVTGTTPNQISALAIIPGSQTITLPLVTPTTPSVFFVAIGLNGSTGLQENETNAVAWTSSDTAVATINNTGGVTPLSQGSTTITAQFNNPASGSTPANVVTATATLTVNGVAAEPLLSIAILPNEPSVSYSGQTDQLIAIGTFSTSPVTQNLNTSTTYPLTWSSSNTSVATISQGGLVTAVGQGTTAITAIASNTDKSVVTGVATFTVTSGVAQQVTALSIIPGSLTLSATGQPGQFYALGTSGTTGLLQDVTNSPQLKWTSNIPTIATVATSPAANAGQAVGVSPGTTNITAEWTNPATTTTPVTVVTAQSSVSVTSTPAAEPLLSITVIPGSITDFDLLGTGQFLAYGNFSTAPTELELTNGFSHAGFPAGCTANCPWQPVTWISTAQDIFPVDSAGAEGATGGLATAEGTGSSDIYALATNPDSTIVYSPLSTFNCPYAAPTYITGFNDPAHMLTPGTCNIYTIGESLLSTLTVFNTGLNTNNWLVTAPSATGTPDVIHCGGTTVQATAGGSVCTASYPNGTVITLTAPHEAGVNFGGWSDTCLSVGPVTQAGPNSCQIVIGGGCVLNTTTGIYTCSGASNVSVGAIFN